MNQETVKNPSILHRLLNLGTRVQSKQEPTTYYLYIDGSDGQREVPSDMILEDIGKALSIASSLSSDNEYSAPQLDQGLLQVSKTLYMHAYHSIMLSPSGDILMPVKSLAIAPVYSVGGAIVLSVSYSDFQKILGSWREQMTAYMNVLTRELSNTRQELLNLPSLPSL